MSLYGVEPWTRNADPFGAYFSLFARLAPLVRREGVLFARVPGTGAVGLDPVPGTVALLLAAIGITAFDGAQLRRRCSTTWRRTSRTSSGAWARARGRRSSSRSASASRS